jgi:hypothetical protein
MHRAQCLKVFWTHHLQVRVNRFLLCFLGLSVQKLEPTGLTHPHRHCRGKLNSLIALAIGEAPRSIVRDDGRGTALWAPQSFARLIATIFGEFRFHFAAKG